jgi:hypothetical protein
MNRQPCRQGDVLLIPVDSIPTGVKPAERDNRGRIVLAEGEKTGHAHAILDDPATLFVKDDLDEMADRFLRVEGEVDVLHEQHAMITLPEGDWIVRQKKEYAPERPRFVAD